MAKPPLMFLIATKRRRIIHSISDLMGWLLHIIVKASGLWQRPQGKKNIPSFPSGERVMKQARQWGCCFFNLVFFYFIVFAAWPLYRSQFPPVLKLPTPSCKLWSELRERAADLGEGRAQSVPHLFIPGPSLETSSCLPARFIPFN